MNSKRTLVQCNCDGLAAKATYEVSGRFLILRSTLGVFKTVAGLRNPQRTAQTLLKNVCAEAAKRDAEVLHPDVSAPTDPVADVPAAVEIVAVAAPTPTPRQSATAPAASDALSPT